MGTITVSLGEVVRKVTAVMDSGWAVNIDCRVLIFGDKILLMTKADADCIMDVVRGLFYRCYGGWDIAMEIDENRKCTGRFSFIPSDSKGFTGLAPVG